MGTDITLYVERYVDGAWHGLTPDRDLTRWPRGDVSRFEARVWGPHGCMREWTCYGEPSGCDGASCVGCRTHGLVLLWYRNRNYDVFSILADVRNDPPSLDVIALPRGVPGDLSDEVRLVYNGAITSSWLGLDEILCFDWSQTRGNETYRDLASDFLAFIDELVIPLLGADYLELARIADEAAQLGHLESSSLQDEALRHASTLRLVFGFDG